MLMESYIEGREFAVSIISTESGVHILPIAQMLFLDYPENRPKIVGYEAKWLENSFAYTHTQRSFAWIKEEPELDNRLRSLALDVWHLFGCTGYARVDVRVDEAGNPFVLELNLNPCIAEDSGFIAACLQSGISYDQVIKLIVEEAWDVQDHLS